MGTGEGVGWRRGAFLSEGASVMLALGGAVRQAVAAGAW